MSQFNEPWKVAEGRGFYLVDANGDLMGVDLPSVTRIVACVNACKGISNDDLAAGVMVKPEPGCEHDWRDLDETGGDRIYIQECAICKELRAVQGGW